VEGQQSNMANRLFVRDLVRAFDRIAPRGLAAEWDNTGLILGAEAEEIGAGQKVPRVLVAIDLTEGVLKEALRMRAGALVCYHPPIFAPLKSITDKTGLDGLVLMAARAGLAIYSPHTALDAVPGGMGDWLAGLMPAKRAKRGSVFAPLVADVRSAKSHALVKIVTFVPEAAVSAVRGAMAEAGAGEIGEYSMCSFVSTGEGTFVASDRARPAVGKRGKLERVTEIRLEMVCRAGHAARAVAALRGAHPYEEAAVDVLPLADVSTAKRAKAGEAGSGRVVNLDEPVTVAALAKRVKQRLGAKNVMLCEAGDTRAAKSSPRVKRVGVCPGSGESLLSAAAAAGCEVFVTGEMKHHEVLAAERMGVSVILAGHTETERGFLPELAARLGEEIKAADVRVSEADGPPLRVG